MASCLNALMETTDSNFLSNSNFVFNFMSNFHSGIEEWPCTIFPRVPDKKEYRALASGKNDEHDAGAVHATMLEQLFEVALLMQEQEYKSAHGVNWEKLASDCVGSWYTKQNCSKAGSLVKTLQSKPKVWDFLHHINRTMVCTNSSVPMSYINSRNFFSREKISNLLTICVSMGLSRNSTKIKCCLFLSTSRVIWSHQDVLFSQKINHFL